MNVDEYNYKVWSENDSNEHSEHFCKLSAEWDDLYKIITEFWDRKYDSLIEKDIIWTETIFFTIIKEANQHFQRSRV